MILETFLVGDNYRWRVVMVVAMVALEDTVGKFRRLNPGGCLTFGFRRLWCSGITKWGGACRGYVHGSN